MKICHEAWKCQPMGHHKISEAKRMGDWIKFLAERQCEGYTNRRDNLRSTGYNVVLSTGWLVDLQPTLANLWTDDCLEMIDRHNYQGGGETLRRDMTTGEIYQNSSHEGPGQGVMIWNHMSGVGQAHAALGVDRIGAQSVGKAVGSNLCLLWNGAIRLGR